MSSLVENVKIHKMKEMKTNIISLHYCKQHQHNKNNKKSKIQNSYCCQHIRTHVVYDVLYFFGDFLLRLRVVLALPFGDDDLFLRAHLIAAETAFCETASDLFAASNFATSAGETPDICDFDKKVKTYN